MDSFRVTSHDEIPAEFGPLRSALRITTIAVREARGVETFTLKWGTLVANPETDVIVVQDSGEEYPVRADIFRDTYEEATSGRFRKKTITKLVQVPLGVHVEIITLEGPLEVTHPDFLVVGSKGEVYANKYERVEENLEFITTSRAVE